MKLNKSVNLAPEHAAAEAVMTFWYPTRLRSGRDTGDISPACESQTIVQITDANFFFNAQI